MNAVLSDVHWKMALLLTLFIIAIISVSTALAQMNSIPGWALDFVVNDKLPQGFRQFRTPRNDGTMLRGFLVDYNGCLEKRKPLMIIIDGSGAQSQFIITPTGRVGTGIYGAIGKLAAHEYHVAACDKRGVEFGYMGKPLMQPSASHRHLSIETVCGCDMCHACIMGTDSPPTTTRNI
jgi:hypothetical protein